MINFLHNRKWNILLIFALSLGFLACSKSDDVDTDSEYVQRYAIGVYPDSTITDGPYITVVGDNYTVRWIDKNSSVLEKTIIGIDDGSFEASFGFPFEYIKEFNNETTPIDYAHEYTGVEKLVALSDIHGQYDIFVNLMRNNGVIDENNNWSFGSGHLVIVGDIFDRGYRVTEILWLVFKLEYQAELTGGKVHYLMGNHEEMVLNNDLRYIDSKYNTTARRMGTTYDQLYSKDMIIGKWLRTKPVIVKINDMVFNHAGISLEVARKNLTIEMVNRVFQEDIIGATSAVINADPLLDFLTSSDGPIWYRGYFDDNNFDLSELNIILSHLNAEHVIVGHTTMYEIKYFFDQKVIAVDSGIKDGMSGEVLIYSNGNFSVGTMQ